MFIRSALLAASVATGAGAAGYAMALPADQPFEHFVACSLGDAWAPEGARAPIFGGRVLVTFDDRIVEVVGPVAGTDAGAAAAAVDYGAVYGTHCDPVPAWDLWKLSTPLIGEVGKYDPVPRTVVYGGRVIDCSTEAANDPASPLWDPCHVPGFNG